MEKRAPCTEEEFSEKYDRYGTMLFRMCMVILGRRQDAEDAVQDTFEKYLKAGARFRDAEHEKAWFLRVAENCCRDKRRAAFFRRTVSMEEVPEEAASEETAPEKTEILNRVSGLPPRCRSVLYLHYVEGYKVREISEILHVREGAVKTALFRGRRMLQNTLKEELA